MTWLDRVPVLSRGSTLEPRQGRTDRLAVGGALRFVPSGGTVAVWLLAVGIVSAYLWLESAYLALPLVGPHAWNESTYLLVIEHMLRTGDPTAFVTRYDPASPNYNGRYLYYWTIFGYLKGLGLLGVDTGTNLVRYVRLFSVASSLAGFVLVYHIARSLVGSNGASARLASVLAAGLFLLSPLVLWYGSKGVIEPYLLAVYLLVMYTVLRTLDGASKAWLYAGAFVFGAVAVSRAPFLVLSAAYPLARVLYPSRVTTTDVALVGVAGGAGFVLPVLVSQAVHPEYAPLHFLVVRFLEVAPRQATEDRTGTLFAIRFVKESLVPTLGLLGFSALAFPLLDRNRFARWCLFFLPSFAYFSLTYRHNVVHNYHNYYVVVPVVLVVAIVLHRLLRYRGLRASRALVLVAVLSLALAGSNVVAFQQEYPLDGDDSVYVSDPAGNKWAIFVGKVLGRAVTPDAGYSLVTSPVTGYHSGHRFIGYKFYFAWNETTRRYERSYDYYEDQAAFVDGLSDRRVTYLVTSPPVHASANESFEAHLRGNFTRIDKVGPYQVFVNRNEDLIERRRRWVAAKYALADDPIATNIEMSRPSGITRVASYPLEDGRRIRYFEGEQEHRSFSTDAVEGERSLRVSSERDTGSGWSQVNLEPVPVEHGRYLVLTSMKYSGVSQAHVVVSGYHPDADRWTQLVQVPPGRDGSAGWSLYEAEFDVPPGVTKIRLTLKAGRSPSGEAPAVTQFDLLEVYALNGTTAPAEGER